MFLRKVRLVLVITIAIAIAIGYACSDRPLNSTYETQGLTSSTAVNAMGDVTDSHVVVCQLSNLDLSDDPPLDLPYPSSQLGEYILVWYFGSRFPVGPGEAEAVVSYSDETLATQGAASFEKQSMLDTAEKAANQNNLKTEKLLGFQGTTTGRVISSEAIVVDTAAQFDRGAGGGYLCPFASAKGELLEPYCNIVKMASDINLLTGQVHTSTSERTVAHSWDVPVSVKYQVDVTGLMQSPALGSASASMNSHIQEGNMNLIESGSQGEVRLDVYKMLKPLDLTYSEKTSTNGAIRLFSKSMQYESGRRRTS